MGRPLYKKLGIRKEGQCCIVHSPKNYSDLTECPFEMDLANPESKTNFDFIHLFAMNSEELDAYFELLKEKLELSGMFWISWPKKSSGMNTDLSSQYIRNYGLDHGLVDVKVCSVDEVWSALKFVYRLEDRDI